MGAVGEGANLRVGCCHKKVEPFGSRILAVFELGEGPGGVGCAFLLAPAVLRSALLGQGALRGVARVVVFARLEVRRGWRMPVRRRAFPCVVCLGMLWPNA